MVVQMTRAEYEAKYGTKPASPAPAAPVQMTRAEYEAKYGPTPQPEQPRGIFETILKRPVERLVLEPARRTGEAIASGLVNLFGTTEQKDRASASAAQDKTLDVPLFGQFRTRGQQGGMEGVKQVAGEAAETASYLFPYGKAAGAATKALGPVAGKAAPFLGKVAAGAGAGYSADVGYDLQQDKTIGEALKPGMGTAVGAALPAAIEGGKIVAKAAAKAIPRLLSYSSDVSPESFNTMLARREATMAAIKQGKTPADALKTARGATRQFRATLSKEWDEGAKALFDTYPDTRVGLSDKEVKMIARVADEFGLDLPAETTLRNLGAKEYLNLMKDVNELYSKRVVKEGASGIIVRKLKDSLVQKGLGTYGGDKGPLATLWGNYSAKKTMFDEVNRIVNAYEKGNPIARTTAQNRLMAIFDENKGAYLDAIFQLEKETGADILSQVAAQQFKPVLPSSISKAPGGLPTRDSFVSKVVELLAFPLTSPRGAGWLVRQLDAAGRGASSIAPAGKTVGDMLRRGVTTGAGQ